MHGSGKRHGRAFGQHRAKRGCPMRGEVVGKRGRETRAGRLPGVVRRAFVVGRFLRLHVLGTDEAAHDAKLAVMIDADDGPCPRLLPVAPCIGAFGQRLDFRLKRVEAFGLVVVKLVAFAQACRLRVRPWRAPWPVSAASGCALPLTSPKPSSVSVRRSGMISTHVQPSCRTASASRSSFSFISRSSNAGSVR